MSNKNPPLLLLNHMIYYIGVWDANFSVKENLPVFSSLAFPEITCIHELDFKAKHGLPITHSGSKILGQIFSFLVRPLSIF